MPTRRDAALLEAEREGEGATASDAAPKLVLALGRGKTGKSTFIRWARRAPSSAARSRSSPMPTGPMPRWRRSLRMWPGRTAPRMRMSGCG